LQFRGFKKSRRLIFALGFFLLIAQACESAASADSPAPDKSVVWLNVGQRPGYPARIGLLSWEIYRQAFLIAARDGLGLQTRDESLREWGTPPPAGTMLQASLDNGFLEFSGSGALADQIVWEDRIRGYNHPENIPEMAVAAEKLSRGEFVIALKAHGWSGKGHVFKPDAPAPAECEALLAQMDEFSQFRVVRLTDAAIAKDGESLPRLGVLVRAYANLGQLTRYHWSIESKVYAARALLYAQRMVALDPNSASALWHRAYARALAGLQRAAGDDLNAADQLHQPNRPVWADLLDAYCHYQTRQLAVLGEKNPSQKSLATFLAYLTVQLSNSQGAKMQVAELALETNPNCLELIDAMCNDTGPGMLNELNGMGPAVFGRILPDRLANIPGLPKSIADLAANLNGDNSDPAARQAVCQALIGAGAPARDSGEPSLAALGRMVQETSFAQCRRTCDFYSMALGGDASDFVKQIWPLVAEHPFRNTIQAYALWHGEDLTAAGKALDNQSFELVTVANWFVLDALETESKPRGPHSGDRVFEYLSRNLDCTSFDLECVLNVYGNTTPVEGAWALTLLQNCSPDSPLLIAEQIRGNWDPAKAADWESKHGENPDVAMALGQHYSKTGQWDDAERCLNTYISLSPDQSGYQALADVYFQQHKEDLWLATLEEFLHQPDYGLQHATVQVQIAQYFMKKGEYAKAVPFADGAAETGAAWAELCAAEAHSDIGDWQTAEQLLADESKQYGDSPFDWFALCVKSGHGDRASAAAALEGYLATPGKKLGSYDQTQWGTLLMLQGDDAGAMKKFAKTKKSRAGVLGHLHIAILQDAAGKTSERDAALQEAINESRDGTKLNQFCLLLQETFQAGPDSIPDTDELDDILKAASPNDRSAVAYLTARYLDTRKRTDQATAYLRQGIAGNTSNDLDMLLSCDALQKRGIDPVPLLRPATQPAQ
jgi:tetratricopeptide (TPR) repeat protein